MPEKKRVTIEELRQIELDIMLDIHQFCEQRGLRCFLSSGTLLGAVRHKGFIPWDDDADLMMPRPDYDRFIKAYQSDKYVLNYPGKPGYYQSIIKVADKHTELLQRVPLADQPIGVHIDVLPLDGESDNINKFVEHETLLLQLHGITFWLRKKRFGLLSYGSPKEVLRRCKEMWHYRKYSLDRIFEDIEKEARRYPYEQSNYVGYITMSNYKYKQRHRRVLFDQDVKVDFEGHQFNAPKGWDEYLTNLFGDYMQLPPEEKRVSAHAWTAYWK